jgi:hypothetical protein
LEISSPTTSITTSCAVATSGRAISKAVRNWLETSPRTGIGASSFNAVAGWIFSGG